MKFVDSEGVQIATESRGTPTRGTILLAMGATASMMWWPERLFRLLSDGGYEVIRFDHRDTGQSTTNSPGEPRYDLNDLAGDLIAILDAYEAKAAHLVGMSLGGYLAQIVALSRPERVKSLTLIASEPVGLEYEAAGIAPEFMEHFGRMAELDWTDREAVADFMLGIARLSAGSAEPFDEASAMKRIIAELDRARNMQSAFNHSAIAGKLDPGMTASSLKQPVLIIHGTEDPIIGIAAARRTAEAVPRSRLLLLERRGHELLDRDIPKIAEAILKLCRSAERATC